VKPTADDDVLFDSAREARVATSTLWRVSSALLLAECPCDADDAEIAGGARLTVQYFKHIQLAAGDLAVQKDRIVVLLSSKQNEEVQKFSQLVTSLRIKISDLNDDEVASSLLQLCLPHYFSPVHYITLTKRHRHAGDLKKAKARLTSPLNRRCQLRSGPVHYHLELASSVVRRSRFWKDPTQVGVLPCFYADL
jgi:hypothetical protein